MWKNEQEVGRAFGSNADKCLTVHLITPSYAESMRHEFGSGKVGVRLVIPNDGR